MKKEKHKNKIMLKCILIGICIIIFLLYFVLFTDIFVKPTYMITTDWGKTKIIKINDCNELMTEVDHKFSSFYSDFNKYLSYKSLKNIKYFNNLEYVRIAGNRSPFFEDVNFLDNDNIEILQFANFYSKDWSAVSNLKNLKEIYLGDVNFTDMSLFNEMDQLSFVFIAGVLPLNFDNVSPNSSIEFLEIKTIPSGTPTDDISGISNYKNVNTLLLYNTKISDISELEELTNLEHLEIVNTMVNNNIEDYDPLLNIVNLKKLYIKNNILTEEQITMLEKKGVEIIFE